MSFSIEPTLKYFRSGQTRSRRSRLEALDRLEKAVRKNEEAIISALAKDIGKPRLESFMGELGFVYDEIRFAKRGLAKWMRPQRVRTPLTLWPSKSYIQREPLGPVLILSPWNYPFQLAVAPLIAALAAGNTVVLKPSEAAPHTAAVLAKLVEEAFPPEYVSVLQGGPEVSSALTQLPFRLIFLTSGTAVAQKVLSAAVAHRTPVVLELGGKSPAIVDATADLDRAAEHLVWGANFNAGQTCVRPDYILVDKQVKEVLIEKMRAASLRFYGEDPSKSSSYGRVINHASFDRLVGLLADGKVVIGGQSHRESKYIAPTFITEVSPSSALRHHETFGPVTWIEGLDMQGPCAVERVAEVVEKNPDPLALYVFSRDRSFIKELCGRLSFGGGAINDVMVQIANPSLPFGGIGNSGVGRYHGRHGFEQLTHARAVVEYHRSPWAALIEPVLRFRFPPYSKLQEKVFRFLS